MNTKRLFIGLGLASSAALATWLLTGDRKKKTAEFISKKANDIKRTLKKANDSLNDSDTTLYV
jgi:hypothetical protein